MRDESAEASDHRHVGSRVLHTLDRWATKPTLALSVVTAVVVWVLYSAVFGFPARLETIFQTLAAATTLAMVFVIQHTHKPARRRPRSASSMRFSWHHRKLTTP